MAKESKAQPPAGMDEEAVAKAAAEEAAAAELAAQAAEAAAAAAKEQADKLVVDQSPGVMPQQQEVLGDIEVTALKDLAMARCGNRVYHLQRGKLLMMDPSHANELSFGGWVAPVVAVG